MKHLVFLPPHSLVLVFNYFFYFLMLLYNNSKVRKMLNYKYGKIYKILCIKTGKCYIGSTCKKYLTTRLEEHEKYAAGYNKSLTSIQIIKNGNYKMSLVEEYQCENKTDLLKRERYWYNYYKESQPDLCVNKNRPILTEEEKQLNRIKALKYINKKFDKKCNDVEWDLS